MKLQKYREFTPTTARYPKDTELEYLCLGLKGEAGELIGKVAKLYRGDKDYEGMRPGIISELGDICWFLSQLAHCWDGIKYRKDVRNLPVGKPHDIFMITRTVDSIYDVCRDLFLTSTLEDEEVLKYTFEHLVGLTYTLAYFLEVEYGVVLDDNYTKLTGRVAAGTIKGDGDGIQR